MISNEQLQEWEQVAGADERVPDVTPGAIAKRFHESYEELAATFGYSTRRESAVPWEELPSNHQDLMIASVRGALMESGCRVVTAPFLRQLIQEYRELQVEFEADKKAGYTIWKEQRDRADTAEAKLASLQVTVDSFEERTGYKVVDS